MTPETRPPLEEAELAAVMRALEAAGTALDGSPPAYGSVWRRIGLEEATGNTDEPELYARSPRSTRGATRA